MRNKKRGLIVKYVVLVLLVLVTLVLPLGGVVSAADEDPFVVSSGLFYVDVKQEGGSSLIEVHVTNVSSIQREINTTLWDKYLPTDNETEWADPSWIVSINPESVTLQPSEKAIINISVSVPAEVRDGRYITWLKVSDVPNELDKPVTIVVRKGSAIPKYDYAISPSSYRLRVTGKSASVVVDDISDESAPPIKVTSRSSGVTIFTAGLETYKDVTISSDSAVAHNPDDVGKSFKTLTEDRIEGWFTPYAEVDGEGNPRSISDNPLKLKPYGIGYMNWEMQVPDSLEDGDYCLAVRIKPAESTGATVGIEYLSILLITVDRGGFNYWWIVIAVSAILLAAAGVLILKK